MKKLKQNERAIVLAINGSDKFRTFLLANGISTGTIFEMNYSPVYAHLVNLTVHNKMLCLRQYEYKQLDWVKI